MSGFEENERMSLEGSSSGGEGRRRRVEGRYEGGSVLRKECNKD